MKTNKYIYTCCISIAVIQSSCLGDDTIPEVNNKSNIEIISPDDPLNFKAPTESGKVNEFTYVNLGFQVNWATYNLEAENVLDCGDFYSWGEIDYKYDYTEENYEWNDPNNTIMVGYESLKYRNYVKVWDEDKEEEVEVRGDTHLFEEDDAVIEHWGNKWRMPSAAEMQQLVDNCNWFYTTNYRGKGITGCIGVSKINGRTIFFPAAGHKFYGKNPDMTNGYYWTSDLSGNDNSAEAFAFNPKNVCIGTIYRYQGISIRPVTTYRW